MAHRHHTEMNWYLATRKDSGAHWVLDEEYIEDYEREFERIREFNTREEALLALKAREEAHAIEHPKKSRKRLNNLRIRGDVRKGSVDDEKLRSTIRAEIEAEMEAEKLLEPPSSEAQAGPKTKKRAPAVSKPTKEILE